MAAVIGGTRPQGAKLTVPLQLVYVPLEEVYALDDSKRPRFYVSGCM